MKKLNNLFFLCLLVSFIGSVKSTKAQVAFESTISQDIVNILGTDYLEISAYIESTGGTSFDLSGGNFAINLNNSALDIANASIVDVGPFDETNDADYDVITLTKDATTGFIKFNVTWDGGPSGTGPFTTVPASVTLIGTARIEITSAAANSNAAWRTGAPNNNTEVYDENLFDIVSTAGTLTNPTGNYLLPVHLTSFNVYAENNSARTTWATAMEENNRGFYLERSTDMKKWELVNFIPSQMENGNSHDVLNYSYTDMNVYKPWTGQNVYYYRLRQQDFNGTEEYVGEVQAVRFGVSSAGPGVTVYPVPAGDVVNITAPAAGDHKLRVTDLIGRTVYESEFNGTATVNVSEFNSGTYSAVVTSQNGEVSMQKIVISR